MEKKWVKEKIISARVKSDVAEKLEELADKNEISLSNLIRNIITEYINKK